MVDNCLPGVHTGYISKQHQPKGKTMNAAIQTFDIDADFFDSRDVIARLEFLTDLEPEDTYNMDEDDLAEIKLLKEIAKQGEENCEDWQYGETFVSDDYFEEYAKDYADNIGAIDSNASWPLTHIDWEAAADDLKQDYTEYTFNGRTFWAR